MAKAKKEPAPVLYRARSRRSEVGIGIVEKGDPVALGDYLSDEEIASLLRRGYYEPVTGIPAPIYAIMEEMKAG